MILDLKRLNEDQFQAFLETWSSEKWHTDLSQLPVISASREIGDRKMRITIYGYNDTSRFEVCLDELALDMFFEEDFYQGERFIILLPYNELDGGVPVSKLYVVFRKYGTDLDSSYKVINHPYPDSVSAWHFNNIRNEQYKLMAKAENFVEPKEDEG